MARAFYLEVPEEAMRVDTAPLADDSQSPHLHLGSTYASLSVRDA